MSATVHVSEQAAPAVIAGEPGEIYDPAVYRRGVPYQAYAWLREHDPVSWQEERPLSGLPSGPGFWAVMRYDDVQYVSKTPALFSASLGCTQVRDPDPADLPFLRAMLLNTDPPAHGLLRRIISPLFTPRALSALAPFITQTTERLVREARDRRDFDLVEDVTDELSLTTLAHILGVPDSDKRLFFGWANRIIGYQDEEYSDGTVPGEDPRSPSVLRDMHDYAVTLREYRKRNPGDDVISALTHARIDGAPLSDEQFKNFFFLFAVAGNDTTRSALPGGLLALIEHPDEWARLRRDPGLLGTAIEECLRFAPPVILFRRTATEDQVLRGRRIAAGDKVVVFYPSANRDAAEFDDPDRFDVTRTPNRHVSFGHGPHICVAATLARLQLGAMFSTATEHLHDLVVTGPVERLTSHLVAGIKRVPVSVDSGSAPKRPSSASGPNPALRRNHHA